MVAARAALRTIGLRRSFAAEQQAQDEAVARREAEEAERVRKTAEIMELRLRQMDEMQAEFPGLMTKFTRGLNRWMESGFAWEEPDWAADPETWPVAARVLYRHVQLNTLTRNIGWLQTVGRPALCLNCRDEGKVDTPENGDFYAFYCPAHETVHSVASVRTLARILFNSQAEGIARKAAMEEERVEVERIAKETELFERLK